MIFTQSSNSFRLTAFCEFRPKSGLTFPHFRPCSHALRTHLLLPVRASEEELAALPAAFCCEPGQEQQQHQHQQGNMGDICDGASRQGGCLFGLSID